MSVLAFGTNSSNGASSSSVAVITVVVQMSSKLTAKEAHYEDTRNARTVQQNKYK
jgi:hypothetical protein